MRLRCRFGNHRWSGLRGRWLVPIARPELAASGDMELEACADCQILRYTVVCVIYGSRA